MTKRRVLVTGASGRIGRAFVRRAAALDVEIFALPGSNLLDITKRSELGRIVSSARPDVIVHLAALTGAACETDPARAVAVNETATRDLVAISEENSVERFVLASSAAVYGEQGPVTLTEQSVRRGTSLYARTKIAAEEIVHLSALPSAVSLRVFNVWGPGFDASLVERLRRSDRDGTVTLTGWNDFVRDYVHVDDVADALGLAVMDDVARRGPVNIGTGVGTSNADVVRILEREHTISYRVVDAQPSHSVASIARAADWWGFEPSTHVMDRLTTPEAP